MKCRPLNPGAGCRFAVVPDAGAAMALDAARFFSLLFVALALAPSAAHLLELPNKIGLARDDYLTVQQIYSGWSLLGFVVFGALLSTLALTVLSWRRGRQFLLASAAFGCVVGTQLVFWAFTYPMNEVTRNWTVLPEVWQPLRAQWEYSHAAAALLNLAALILLILCLLAAVRAGDRRRATTTGLG